MKALFLPAHLQMSEPGMYCERRAWRSGMRRRSTHRFSQRNAGDIGQDEQDNVSWEDEGEKEVVVEVTDLTEWMWCGKIVFQFNFGLFVSHIYSIYVSQESHKKVLGSHVLLCYIIVL